MQNLSQVCGIHTVKVNSRMILNELLPSAAIKLNHHTLTSICRYSGVVFEVIVMLKTHTRTHIAVMSISNMILQNKSYSFYECIICIGG
jgi:hypothetical protein